MKCCFVRVKLARFMFDKTKVGMAFVAVGRLLGW